MKKRDQQWHEDASEDAARCPSCGERLGTYCTHTCEQAQHPLTPKMHASEEVALSPADEIVKLKESLSWATQANAILLEEKAKLLDQYKQYAASVNNQFQYLLWRFIDESPITIERGQEYLKEAGFDLYIGKLFRIENNPDGSITIGAEQKP